MQQCFYIKGQGSKEDQTDKTIGRILPVIIGVMFSVGSILVVSHFALKQNLSKYSLVYLLNNMSERRF